MSTRPQPAANLADLHRESAALVIRYADPDTTPSRYPLNGWGRVSSVVTDDYWTITGPLWLIRSHVEEAMRDGNLNDYMIHGSMAF